MSVQIGFSGALGVLTFEPFKGEDASSDFAKWAKITARNLDASGVEKEPQQVKLILGLLQGQAALIRESYYSELDKTTPTAQQFQTVKALIEYFAPKFKQPNAEIWLRQKLLDLKQTGRLEDYIQEEESIVGSTELGSEMERIFLFVNGLKPEILKAVLERTPTTFTQAKDFAMSFITKSETLSSIIKNVQPIQEQDNDRMEIYYLKTEIKKNSEDIAALYVKKNFSYKPKIVYAAPMGDRVPIDINSRWEPPDRNITPQSKIDTPHLYPQYNNYYTSQTDNITPHISTQNNDNYATQANYHNSPTRNDTHKSNHLLSDPITPSFTGYRETKLIPDTPPKIENTRLPLYENDSHSEFETSDIEDIRGETKMLKIDSNIISEDESHYLLGKKYSYDTRPIFNAKVNGTCVRVLLDSGATTNFVATYLAQKLKLETYSTPIANVVVANGSSQTSNSKSNAPVKFDNKEINISAYIFPLKTIDVILGYDFWRKYKINIDYENNAWSGIEDNRTFKVVREDENVPTISRHALNKNMRKNNLKECWAVFIKGGEENKKDKQNSKNTEELNK
ncbi:hypothetical protein BB560_004694 [Smittium megazygosporum]|uniref:Retrotransposon gag domain-containing protein n=1 Tax=Smittium megazygosporum TaxID=133381 RepID=A0A2T9Z8I3_9FUNG|nr:hypothetical protein BB560_004694 [Smittium megazygosporum]